MRSAPSAQDLAIVAYRNQGYTLRMTAEKFGMTLQRARLVELRTRDYCEADEGLKSDPDDIMLLARTGHLRPSSAHALLADGICKITQLQGFTYHDLSRMPNMGRISAEQIVRLAAQRGIEIVRRPRRSPDDTSEREGYGGIDAPEPVQRDGQKMTQPRKRPENLLGWPRLLTIELAAAYVGHSVTSFRADVGNIWPQPVASKRRRVWDRLALDQTIDQMPGAAITDRAAYLGATRGTRRSAYETEQRMRKTRIAAKWEE
jgi:hypothetical protein